MGEMADYFNEQLELDYEQRSLYSSSGMSIQEAYDTGIIDEHGAEYGTHKPLVCKHCGATGLVWLNTSEGWRTSINGKIHKCPKFNSKTK